MNGSGIVLSLNSYSSGVLDTATNEGSGDLGSGPSPPLYSIVPPAPPLVPPGSGAEILLADHR